MDSDGRKRPNGYIGTATRIIKRLERQERCEEGRKVSARPLKMKWAWGLQIHLRAAGLTRPTIGMCRRIVAGFGPAQGNLTAA
jgi:hypothetical protein